LVTANVKIVVLIFINDEENEFNIQKNLITQNKKVDLNHLIFINYFVYHISLLF
jgi:hypothetical protein